MRRLIRDTGRSSDESGAISVLVALVMVVLLGFAALAVDVGMLYSEKAQLQNGADAAALGIAQSCAATPVDPLLCSSSSAVATELTNGNSLDGLSAVQSVALSANRVAVTTAAKEAGRSDNRVTLFFAQALGISSAEVGARASAAWGSPTSGPAPFPVVFSECELLDGPGLQLIQFRLKDDTASGCAGGPPGGFSNLDQVPGKCEALVDINNAASGSSTGNGIPANCSPLLTTWRDQIIAGTPPVGLFPIYETITDSGTNAIYSLTGFAAFEVHGWKLKQTGNPAFPEAFRHEYHSGAKCSTTQCIGIIGKFVKMVSLADAYTLGPYDPSMGTAVVKLTLEEATP
ncbi:pilus assembly protein TadG [Arthrobacter cheniae]|uniref:Pilus assembly protein TadG n=1 Tax=Arthrobacter cheniae TaxID=1258888 RepID=A0A3A5M9V2_9MICC|nr:Tad domain-containing protein [Arthrobacter cheniae]RJT82951.1 pilus assembly protein TadG [Arthrobacter cheniae]